MNQNKKSEVSLLLTDDHEICHLNKIYRKIDSPTDVLSFSLLEGQEDFALPSEMDQYLLGDIVVSVETAQRQAKVYSHSFQDELIILLIHGFLHLLGFDHMNKDDSEKMQLEEKRIIQCIQEEISSREF